MATGLLNLTDQATVRYNGISFGSHSKIKVSTEFVPDSADRTVIGHKHLMTVEAIVTPDDQSGLDLTMEEMRASLGESGGTLNIEGAGFGDLVINGSGGTDDLNFGPKPRVLTWQPIGNNLAAEIVWQVEFMTSPCPDTADSGLMAFNYEIAFSINERGFTTRTVSGSLVIAMTRNGRQLPDNADNYRHLINVVALRNFKRESQNYSISADKRTLSFSIVDREIESQNAWPPGVVEISAAHRVAWKKRGRARKLLPNMLSMNVKLAHDQPKARAWAIFRSLFFNRISVASLNPEYPVILEGLEVAEEIYGTNISFNIEYTVTAELSTFFTLTRILAPIGFDWQEWKQSMLLVEDDRGIAQISNTELEDKIVDICDSTTGTPSTFHNVSTPPTIGFTAYCNEKPPPEYSYTRFDSSLTDETETGSFNVKTLGNASVEPNLFLSSDPSSSIERINTDSETAEIQGVPYQRFRWTGVAERVGYSIPKPHLTHVGTGEGKVPVRLVGKPIFMQRFEGFIFCQPRYTAAWNFLYEVVERPDNQDSRYSADPLASEG